MKRGCEITVSMEKEGPFVQNERKVTLLPLSEGDILPKEKFIRGISIRVWKWKRLKALIPSSVHLYTPASSSTLQNTFSDFLFQNLFDIFFCNIVVL